MSLSLLCLSFPIRYLIVIQRYDAVYDGQPKASLNKPITKNKERLMDTIWKVTEPCLFLQRIFLSFILSFFFLSFLLSFFFSFFAGSFIFIVIFLLNYAWFHSLFRMRDQFTYMYQIRCTVSVCCTCTVASYLDVSRGNS